MGGSFSMELTINNITKQYGNVTVLDDVSYRFTIYNMMIPGSKGQKADASLLARGFLNS